VKQIKEPLFLLSLVPFREADLVVNLLSRHHGRLAATLYRGRHLGKQCSFPYHPGDLLEAEYQLQEGRDFIRVIDTVAVHLLNPKDFTYARFLYHSYLLELIKSLSQPGNPAEDLFRILETNHQARWHEDRCLALMGWSLWQLVKYGGYQIDYHQCRQCGKITWKAGENGLPAFRKGSYDFQLDSGGLVCEGCYSDAVLGERLTPAMIKACWLLDEAAEFSQLTAEVPPTILKPLLGLFNRYLLDRFELSPRSLPFFLSLLQ